jgi:hypothetical protein
MPSPSVSVPPTSTNDAAQPTTPAPAAEHPAKTATAGTPDANDLAAWNAALAADSSQTTAVAANAPQADAGGQPATATSALNPDISAIADFALAAYSKRHNLQLGAHDPSLNGFNFQALELALGAAVDPYFRFDSNIVFNTTEVDVEEAYATTLDLPAQLQVRAGQFLTRFGRANPTHPHTWDYADQPFALTRVFGGEGNRGIGSELSWLSPLPWYVELVASATTASGAASSRSFYGGSGRGVNGPADLLYVTSIKQFFPLSDAWSLAWGLSGAFGPNAQGKDMRTEVYGTDLYLKWRPLRAGSVQTVSLHAEMIYRRREIPWTTLQDYNSFASLLWRFAQRWSVASRYEWGSAALDDGFHTRPDYLDPQVTAERQRVTASLSHYPTEFSRLRLQGSVDLPKYLPAPIWAGLLSLEIAIGAHGAHAF